MSKISLVIDYSDRKPLGRSGEKVSAIGIGTWAIRDYKSAEKALIHAIELGLNMIDTAEMYGDGKAEELVGRVVKSVGRENIFITTKLLPHHFRDRDGVLKAALQSLRRLNVECVDLILIHWPNTITPIDVQIKMLELLADKGFTRYIGVSNFSKEELKLAIEATKKYEIVVNQVKYSVLDRHIEYDLLPYAIKERVTIQAYTPLERGAIIDNSVLRRISGKYGKTPVQIALNYLISHYYVTAIPKSERVEHIDEIKGALGWRLKVEDIMELKKI